MEALAMMLKNTSTNTYHPIMYWESPLPGGFDSEGNKNLIRYKSKGHHTKGFDNREDAVKSIDSQMEPGCKHFGYHLNRELDGDLIWDGLDMPVDVQLRGRDSK